MDDIRIINVDSNNEAISLCGFNCGIYPAYKLNLKIDKDRVKVDEG